MALSPFASTSPLPRQLLRYVSSGLTAAFDHRAPPTISLPSLRAVSRGAARSPPGRPGEPRPGNGGRVHAALATATAARAVVMRGPAPPGPPAQGSGGKTNSVVMMRGPAPPSARPAQGSGGKVHAVSPAGMASVVMRGPASPGPPAQGAGGHGGSINSIAS